MALFLFTENIIEGKPIDVFNYGNHRRDFTYVDDIVEGVIRTMDHTAEPNPDGTRRTRIPGTSAAPYRIYNIGNQQPVELMRYIEVIEECLGTKAEKNLLPLQPGDVPGHLRGYRGPGRRRRLQADTPIEEGIRTFVDWYLDFYNVDLSAVPERA